MTRLFIFVALALAAFLTTTAPEAWADDRYGQQKAVYDVNYSGGTEAASYYKVLKNVQNHLDAVGDDRTEIKIVLSGEGLEMLSTATSDLRLQGVISDLKTRGVPFLVCNNTLVGRNIDPDSLFDVFEEDIVPSGNAELAHLQGQGYAYLKP